MLTIRPMSEALLPLYRQIDTRSLASERAVVSMDRARLALGYVRLPSAAWVHRAPADDLPADFYLTHADSACFFAFEQDQCVGELSLRVARNAVADVLDVRVEAGRRRQGIGRELLRTAVLWAQGRGVDRFRLETDDENPVACQFATGSGFSLGGFDTQALAPRADRRPCALFFYLPVAGA